MPVCKLCKATLLKPHFGMGVLLYICCIYSEHIFLRTSLKGCFWILLERSEQRDPEIFLEKSGIVTKWFWGCKNSFEISSTKLLLSPKVDRTLILPNSITFLNQLFIMLKSVALILANPQQSKSRLSFFISGHAIKNVTLIFAIGRNMNFFHTS